jgi:hypothetical protein
MYRTARSLLTLSIVTAFLGAMSLFGNMEEEDDFYQEG